MKNQFRIALALGASLVSISVTDCAFAQDRAPESDASTDAPITVTGSKLVTRGTTSPTPLTIVSTEDLKKSTPSDIPSGLNKLPVFQGSQQPGRPGDGSSAIATNVLALRGFGPQRTLVLLNGHRLTPANADGTVDADTIPQMLVSRVDVVTGGASAVYGSDAVAGVVNFILDTKFNGLKLEANAGLSTYGDGASAKVGAAFGSDILGGKGHIIVSAQHFQQQPVQNSDRETGRRIYVLTGSGTVANPFTVTADTRRADSTFGSLIRSCTAPCSVLGYSFAANGILAPFVTGTPTGTGNQNQGGDGAYGSFTALSEQRHDEVFARLDFDVSPSTQFYAQFAYAKAFSGGHHFPVKLTPGATQASNFFKNNPFLSPTVQAQLGNNGLSDASNLFGVGKYILDLGPDGLVGAAIHNTTSTFSTGLTGLIGDRFHWDVYYTHGVNRSKVDLLNNSNYQKQFAALDAVVGSNGSVQCYAATQAATAAQYAGCVPLNPFGPTSITPQAFGWFTQTTSYTMINGLDDIGGSIAGDAFNNWAGPVTFAVSAEWRHNKYKVESDFNPAKTVDCTGLRICNNTLPLFAQPVLAPLDVSNSVWEAAVEVGIPLAKDLPLIKNLEANLAGRHTNYSTSGSVDTWKVGLVYDISDEFRIRGTASVDIRAPTLNDLFQPAQVAVTGFNDFHTGISNTLFRVTSGNVNLVPEVAHTFTVGGIWKPNFAPGLSVSFDYYNIRTANALGAIDPSNSAIQNLCENSGGSSPFCSLYLRPLAFSDRTAANFPTRIFVNSLNTAVFRVAGYDFEMNYNFDWNGAWNLRLLGNYQPVIDTQAFPGAPIFHAQNVDGQIRAAPKKRATLFVGYAKAGWNLSVQDRWLGGFSQVITDGQVWAKPNVAAFNTVDFNISRDLSIGGTKVSVFLNVQNAFNAVPDIAPASGSVGVRSPFTPGQDVMGRYGTIGLKINM